MRTVYSYREEHLDGKTVHLSRSTRKSGQHVFRMG